MPDQIRAIGKQIIAGNMDDAVFVIRQDMARKTDVFAENQISGVAVFLRAFAKIELCRRVFLKEADHAVRVVVVRMTEHRAVDVPDGKTERAHVFGKQAGRARVNQNAAAPMRCENRKSPFAMKRLLRNIIYNDGQFRLHGVSPFFVFLHCKRKAAASSSVCSDDSPAAEGSPGRMENSGL